MGLMAAKCPNCGADITIDKDKDAGICPHCGTAFVTEKVISNYNIHNNIQEQNNIYYNSNETETDKENKKVLLRKLFIEMRDYNNMRSTAVDILKFDVNDELARLVYDCDFRVINLNGYSFGVFNERPLLQYFKANCGKIDWILCKSVIHAMCFRNSTEDLTDEIIQILLLNIENSSLSKEEKIKAYSGIFAEIVNSELIDAMKDMSSGSYFGGGDEGAGEAYAAMMEKSRKSMANSVEKFFNTTVNSKYSEEEKRKITGSTSFKYNNNKYSILVTAGKVLSLMALASMCLVAISIPLIAISIILFAAAFTMILGGKAAMKKGKKK